jgi:hypothetical protein
MPPEPEPEPEPEEPDCLLPLWLLEREFDLLFEVMINPLQSWKMSCSPNHTETMFLSGVSGDAIMRAVLLDRYRMIA